MVAFTQIALPHSDITKGRLTMDVFAADLWQVASGKAPSDYQDPALFFKKTYLTKGLSNILEVAKSRLRGKTGDSVIQLQTPFGGGKTHALIALYHKAREWGAKVAVFDGTAFDASVRPWEEIERQLTGKVDLTQGNTSPGKEKLTKLLSQHAPVLILMDELLEYMTKAAGVKVGDSNLAAQTKAFLQEITGAASSLGNALLVVTLPSSVLERYDEVAEKLFQQLQKILGRVERIYTPVEEDEIENVIRARLFQRIDESKAKSIVDEFVNYAVSEGLLSKDESHAYRERFVKSYPFKPDVIDVLYKRWGSFPTFQRTRGVLRLLSLVVHDLMGERLPFIRLGDFNLSNSEIKRELIKHIGQEWDSIIAQDITSSGSGAKKVDESIGVSYIPYKLGTVVSTTIFMLSFSGKGRKEASIKDIKLSSTQPDFSSTVIDTVISQLKERLFYLSDEGLYFTNQPNLNRIILTREENIQGNELTDLEKSLIENHISKDNRRFKVLIWPKFSKDIPDTGELKLVILKEGTPEKDLIDKYGEQPRIYKNTVIFLCPDPSQEDAFYGFLRKLSALKSIEKDKSFNLTDAQKKEVKSKLKSYEERSYEELRKFYRKLFVPTKNGFKSIDLGIPTFGEKSLDNEIYSRLRSEGEILERVSAMVIKEKYLKDKDYIETRLLLDAFLKTPGEMRIASESGLKEGIKEGVESGLFGLGLLTDGNIRCRYFKEEPEVTLEEGEILIKPELCETKEEMEKEPETEKKPPGPEPPVPEPIDSGPKPSKSEGETTSGLKLSLDVPAGQISTVVKVVNVLRLRFSNCRVKVLIEAADGSLSQEEMERIEEAFIQAGIEVEKWERS